MIAEELINNNIPPLKPSDSINKALKWMEEFRINQLPVVEDETFKGMVMEDNLLLHSNPDMLIEDIQPDNPDLFIKHNNHFYNVLDIAFRHQLQIIPVIDDDNKYIGVITIGDTLSAIAQMCAIQGRGGIIVLHIMEHNYSLTEISKIVESNDAKILSAFVVNEEENPYELKVTLKINQEDISRIIAAFKRYEYDVEAAFHTTDFSDQEKERLDLLFKYLDI